MLLQVRMKPLQVCSLECEYKELCTNNRIANKNCTDQHSDMVIVVTLSKKDDLKVQQARKIAYIFIFGRWMFCNNGDGGPMWLNALHTRSLTLNNHILFLVVNNGF